MSMPVQITISCSLCDFSTSEMIIWGYYRYMISENVFHNISRAYGWCYSCKNIEPVEDFPNKQELEKELEVLNNKSKRWNALTGFKSNRAIETVDKEIKKIQEWLPFLNLRKDPPRCLTCGSTDIVKIGVPHVKEGETFQLTFTHPNCGGTFTVSNKKDDSAIRFCMSFPPKLYDINGQAIIQKKTSSD